MNDHTGKGSPAPRGDSSDKKRRTHRRAKKSGRKRNASGENNTQSSPSSPQAGPSQPTFAAPLDPKRRRRSSEDTIPLPGGGRRQVYLRPTNGPLLNAPRNSTQFIIDDHERFLFQKEEEQNSPQQPTSSSKDVDSDEDYSERDFETVYKSAHREEIAAWDRKRICDEIANLERRQKDLVGVLARLDPEMYMEKLRAEVVGLKETNRVLRREKALGRRARKGGKVSPDSSSSTH